MSQAKRIDFHKMDDGATEVVDVRPRRRGRPPVKTSKVAKAKSGGGIARFKGKGDSQRRDFILLRKTGQPAVKIAIAHGVLFKLLWQAWAAKRFQSRSDPGVAIAELSKMLIAKGTPMANSSISANLRSLINNGVVRSIDQYVGLRGRRTRYYPTPNGIQVLALAEVLGDGSFVQVGRTTKSWRNSSQGEPASFFLHARRIRGWDDAAIPA